MDRILLSSKGLRVLKGSSLAAASRLATMGNRQHELFKWTHSPANLGKKIDNDFVNVDEKTFVKEILDFNNDICKRTFFLVSPQGTGKSEACICVKHAFEEKFSDKNFPPPLYVQRDAPAIKFLNKASPMAEWLGDDINTPALQAFSTEDKRLTVLKELINDPSRQDIQFDPIVTSVRQEIKNEFGKDIGAGNFENQLHNMLKDNLKNYLSAHFPEDELIRETEFSSEARRDFFDQQDISSTSPFRNYVDTLHNFLEEKASKSQIYELLNRNVMKSLGGKSTHLSEIITTIGGIARERGTHLLVIFEDFFALSDSIDTQNYADLVTSDISPDESMRDNITLLFAGLPEGISGLRQISHNKTGRVNGEYRTAESEEEDAPSIVVTDPVDFARKYILWAKNDEGLIEQYEIDKTTPIPSPSRDFSKWSELTPLSQQLFPFTESSINFIWNNLVHRHPRSFLDFIRKLLDEDIHSDKWKIISRMKLFHEYEMKQDWDDEGQDDFYSTHEYIFYKMYGKGNDADIIREIFQLDEWNESTTISPPSLSSSGTPSSVPVSEIDEVSDILNKWRLGGRHRRSIEAKVYEYEKEVWQSILERFFNTKSGINYENPVSKEILLTQNFTIIKPRNSADGDSKYEKYGLKLEERANRLLERQPYRILVVKLGNYIQNNNGEWYEFDNNEEEIVSTIVSRVGDYIKEVQFKLQNNLSFEKLEDTMLSFKIFEGMWRSLLTEDEVNFKFGKSQELSFFQKSFNIQTKSMLSNTERAIQPMEDFEGHTTAVRDLRIHLEKLASQSNFNETKFFEQIFSYRIRKHRILRKDALNWTRYLSTNNSELRSFLQGWSMTKSNNKLENWLNYIDFFSNRWFQSNLRRLEEDPVVKKLKLLIHNEEIIRKDGEVLISKINKLDAYGRPGKIRSKWVGINDIDLRFIFNEKTLIKLFPHRDGEITNGSGVPFIVSFIFSLIDVEKLNSFLSICLEESRSKEKISSKSENEIIENWQSMKSDLQESTSIANILKELVKSEEDIVESISSLDTLLDKIIQGEGDIDDVRKKILLCHIESILFNKENRTDGLQTIFSETDFNQEELVKYSKILKDLDLEDYEKLPNGKANLDFIGSIDVTNLQTIEDIENLFFTVKPFHDHSMAEFSYWPQTIDAVFNEKSIQDDLSLEEVEKLREEVGDLLVLKFKKSD